jgi:ribosome-binding protein aMBF1 (putative translation factor)
MTRSKRQRKAYEESRRRMLADPQVRREYEQGMPLMHVAVRIAWLREQMGLTQTELAAKLKTSQSMISRIENGMNIELETLQRVADALNADVKIELVPKRA